MHAVALSCARTREGGYHDQQEEPLLMTRARLSENSASQVQSMDFLAFTAEAQAHEHSVTVEDEIRRMEGAARASL